MALIAAAFFGISCLFALAEIYHEHDWPRDMFKFVLISGAVLYFFIR